MRRLHLFLPHLPLHLALARRSEPFPTGPLVLGGRAVGSGSGHRRRARTREPSASGAGCRSGAPIDSSLRRPSSTPIPMRTGRTAEAVFEALAGIQPEPGGECRPARRGVRAVRARHRRPRAVVGCRAGARRAAGRRRCRRHYPGTPGHGSGSPARTSRRRSPRWRPGRMRPIVVPPGDEAAFLADRPSGLLTTDPDVRARLDSLRAAPDRRRGRPAAVGADRPVRRGGSAAARPGQRPGDRAVPSTSRDRAPRPRPAHRAAGRGPRAAPVRAPSTRRGAGRAAHGTGSGRGPGGADPGARPRVRPDRDRRRGSRSSSASRNPPRTPRPSSACCSPGSSGSRRRPPSSGSTWSCAARPPAAASNCRCSCPRPRGRPGSAGSSPGWP